jgi:selenocysteine-specific elongation factor
MRNLILGTAGHIDHGKTALVRALTGVDTDRLKEEKARGITIELGFAELEVGPDLRYGVVDVPGHEGFVRTMVAGATGMDVVLMVVAADEGVMPQTREHLAIVRLLGVERLAVALTKTDLVDEEWLELVRDDVEMLLADTPFAEADIVPTSAETGAGLDTLRRVLARLGEAAAGHRPDDIPRLPIDRVFTVRGTGTVVTGTLWSGTLERGRRVQVEPDGPEARIRALQVHGADTERALPGSRTAVALVGPDVGRGGVARGQALVHAWPPSRMLTARVAVIEDTAWHVEHGQRVRVHAGTAEVMARCIVPDGSLGPGDVGWVQLRLEAPVVARATDRLIIRSYSPVTTIGGAVVAEPYPVKRSRFDDQERAALEALLSPDPGAGVGASVALAGWGGRPIELLPVTTGLATADVQREVAALVERGGVDAGGIVFGPAVVADAEQRMRVRVAEHHADFPLEAGVPLQILRQALPRRAPAPLADAAIRRLEGKGVLVVKDGLASAVDFEVILSPEARAIQDRLAATYRDAGMTPPAVKELPQDLRGSPDLEAILHLLLSDGSLRVLDDGLYVWGAALDDAVGQIQLRFAGRDDLVPSDFREVLSVTRKHLMPLLAFLDGQGITVRTGDLRAVRGVEPEVG